MSLCRTNQTISPTPLHDARIAFLAAQSWTHALTLSYNDWPIPFGRIRHDLRALHARIDRAYLGTRFHLLPREQRSRFVAMVEGIGHHPHIHLMLWIRPGPGWFTFARMLEGGLWQQIAPAGSYRLNLMTDARGWAGYCLKEFGASDEWISSEDFLPPRPHAVT